MQSREKWSGTATELLSQMQESDTPPNVITKLLNEYRATVLNENNIYYDYKRTKAGRRIVLSRGDGVDSGDGYFGIPQNAEVADTDTVSTDTVLLSEAESVG